MLIEGEVGLLGLSERGLGQAGEPTAEAGTQGLAGLPADLAHALVKRGPHPAKGLAVKAGLDREVAGTDLDCAAGAHAAS
ncbi:hypothetical protein AB0I84_07510 [Streptomyces spectabilis]|uniref:hypothetical protein n=1 Tax=Streptomyces spectabilis TaxID=68270 RepID=UPI0033CB942E